MKRLIVAMTGASGAIYGIRALEALRGIDGIETHLVISPSALYTIAEETDTPISELKALADSIHNFKDIGASLSSGSYPTLGIRNLTREHAVAIYRMDYWNGVWGDELPGSVAVA